MLNLTQIELYIFIENYIFILIVYMWMIRILFFYINFLKNILSRNMRTRNKNDFWANLNNFNNSYLKNIKDCTDFFKSKKVYKNLYKNVKELNKIISNIDIDSDKKLTKLLSSL